MNRVLHVDNAPLAVKALTELLPVVGRTAVVDVDIVHAAAGEEGNVPVETATCGAGRTAVAVHNEWRERAFRSDVAAGRRFVEDAVRGAVGRRRRVGDAFASWQESRVDRGGRGDLEDLLRCSSSSAVLRQSQKRNAAGRSGRVANRDEVGVIDRREIAMRDVRRLDDL